MSAARPSPLLLKAAAGGAIALAWEATARLAAPDFVARPSSVLAALPRVLGSAAFLRDAWSTIGAVLLGLALSLVAGTAAGLAMGRLRLLDWSFRYHLGFLYAMPLVAVLPLMTLWFGYSAAGRLATIVFAATLTLTTSVAEGARAVPPEYLEVARSLRARWHHVLVGVALPASVPHLLAGVRLAAGRALIAAVVAEFFIAIDGIGYYILFNCRTFRHAEAFVAVLVLAMVAVAVEVGMSRAGRRFLRWHPR